MTFQFCAHPTTPLSPPLPLFLFFFNSSPHFRFSCTSHFLSYMLSPSSACSLEPWNRWWTQKAPSRETGTVCVCARARECVCKLQLETNSPLSFLGLSIINTTPPGSLPQPGSCALTSYRHTYRAVLFLLSLLCCLFYKQKIQPQCKARFSSSEISEDLGLRIMQVIYKMLVCIKVLMCLYQVGN